jgi:hypothetical protein
MTSIERPAPATAEPPGSSPLAARAKPGIIQNAYVVNDIDQAIEKWHRTWGVGPFLVRRHITMDQVWYRGRPSTLDISAAFVQAGPMQIEFICQHDDLPSAFRDAFPSGSEGLHHVAVMPDDYPAAVKHFVSLGYPVATELRTRSGRGASFVDTRPLLGHMVEIYPVSDGVLELYRRVAEEAARWDGHTLKIELDSAS